VRSAACAALEKAAEEARAIISEATPIVALEPAFGEKQEWFDVHGKCYTTKVGVFNYKLCP